MICISIISLAFNLVINLSGVFWKEEIYKLYPNPSDYNIYMNQIISIIGAVSSLITLFVCTPALKYLGWTKTALITPILTGLTGILFFGTLILFPDTLLLTTTLGSLHSIIKRSSRYTLYDATKEMAYIPVDPITRIHGKATICGLGSRIGRTSGSFLIQGLLLTFPSLIACAPYIAVIFILALVIFVSAVISLGMILEPKQKKSLVVHATD